MIKTCPLCNSAEYDSSNTCRCGYNYKEMKIASKEKTIAYPGFPWKQILLTLNLFQTIIVNSFTMYFVMFLLNTKLYSHNINYKSWDNNRYPYFTINNYLQ